MNHFMDFDPHLIRERNELMRQEARSVRLEKALRENGHRERKEERAGMKETLGGFLGRIAIPTPAIAVVALLALILAATGTAVAAGSFTASDGTITACRDNRTGALRIIGAAVGQTCTSKETQLSWKDGITGQVADSLHADQADSAQNAANADTVDGKHAADFYAQGAKVADSDKLDGQDSTAFAGFGETTYKSGVFVPPCSGAELVSKTFSVPRQTLVYASATTVFRQDTTDASGFIELLLLDASTNQLLGTAGYVYTDVEDGGGPYQVPLSVQGVLHEHSGEEAEKVNIYDTNSTPLELSPGNQYKLVLRGRTAGLCVGGGQAAFRNLNLTYLLVGKP